MKSLGKKIKKFSPAVLSTGLLGVLLYFFWPLSWSENEVQIIREKNGIWISHGWLGDDSWFIRNDKESEMGRFRNEDNISVLAQKFLAHGISDVYPHLAPVSETGFLPGMDAAQAKRFLRQMKNFRVMPWVGGVAGKQVFAEDRLWRRIFCRSVTQLLRDHPEFAGIHVNIEPWPSGDEALLQLLTEIREEMPDNTILSVAAYPPPTLLHPYEEIHWDKNYYQQVSKVADQLVVMMYDTALDFGWLYKWLLRGWTQDVLLWAETADILLGIPAYDDFGVGYHNPDVENISNAIIGISSGLSRLDSIPENYQGISVYSNWEMSDDEWELLRTFL